MMFESDRLGVLAANRMAEFYKMRSAYRARPTKRGKERLDAKGRAVDALFRKSKAARASEK